MITFNERHVREYYRMLDHEKPTEIRVFDEEKYPDGKAIFVKTEDEFVKEVKNFNQKEKINVYCGFRDRVGTKGKDVVSSERIFIEIDEHDCKKPEELPKLNEFLADNSIRVDYESMSGGGYHLYIPMKKVNFSDDKSRQEHKDFLLEMKRILLENDIDIDKRVFDLPRVSRITGAFNWTRNKLSHFTKISKLTDEELENNSKAISKLYEANKKKEVQKKAKTQGEKVSKNDIDVIETLKKLEINKTDTWLFDIIDKQITIKDDTGGNSVVFANAAIILSQKTSDYDEINTVGKELAKLCDRRTYASFQGWLRQVKDDSIGYVIESKINDWIDETKYPLTKYSKKENIEEPKGDELSLLKNPDLLNIINNEFDKKIVGEIETRKAMFLNCCGKYVKNCSIASYNLCINSNSGAGKDWTGKNVIKLFPSKDVVIRSRISPTAFTYWHNSKFEPDWTWEGKICYLVDVSNAILNHEVFKLMCSDGNFSTIVINQKATDIEIKGKPVMFITTASASPNNEMLRRFPFCELNETINQTKAIQSKQADAALEGKSLEYNPLITEALSKLNMVKVKIPFAKELVKSFPSEHLIMRTHFQRLLDYIKSSAALHQYQRETDEEGFIIAKTEDYDNATIPLKVTTSNPFMIPLSKKQKMLLAECEKLYKFSVKKIEPHIPFLSQSKIYKALDKLQELGFLTSYSVETEKSKKSVRYYEFINLEMKEIPLWEDIKNCRKEIIKGREINKIKEINEGNVQDENNNSLNSPSIYDYETKKTS